MGAAAAVRIEGVAEVYAQISTSGLLAISVLVSGVLLSSAVVVLAARSGRQAHLLPAGSDR